MGLDLGFDIPGSVQVLQGNVPVGFVGPVELPVGIQVVAFGKVVFSHFECQIPELAPVPVGFEAVAHGEGPEPEPLPEVARGRQPGCMGETRVDIRKQLIELLHVQVAVRTEVVHP